MKKPSFYFSQCSKPQQPPLLLLIEEVAVSLDALKHNYWQHFGAVCRSDFTVGSSQGENAILGSDATSGNECGVSCCNMQIIKRSKLHTLSWRPVQTPSLFFVKLSGGYVFGVAMSLSLYLATSPVARQLVASSLMVASRLVTRFRYGAMYVDSLVQLVD